MGFTGVGGRLSHLGCESTDAIPGRNAYISKREQESLQIRSIARLGPAIGRPRDGHAE